MRVQFISKDNAPERLVCEAELVFDQEGPLSGLKLVGLCIWRDAEGELFVTFPSRAYGAGSERRYFDYLRSADGTGAETRRVKAWILEEYRTTPRAA